VARRGQPHSPSAVAVVRLWLVRCARVCACVTRVRGTHADRCCVHYNSEGRKYNPSGKPSTFDYGNTTPCTFYPRPRNDDVLYLSPSLTLRLSARFPLAPGPVRLISGDRRRRSTSPARATSVAANHVR